MHTQTRLQQADTDRLAASQQQAQTLRDQQAARLAEMSTRQDAARARTAEQQEIARVATELAETRRAEAMAAGESVASSLDVLSKQGGKQGKTATQSKRRTNSKGSRQTTASLSIGATGTGGGSGSNLSI